jgi:hypothetical protein
MEPTLNLHGTYIAREPVGCYVGKATWPPEKPGWSAPPGVVWTATPRPSLPDLPGLSCKTFCSEAVGRQAARGQAAVGRRIRRFPGVFPTLAGPFLDAWVRGGIIED